ncbi:MAG: CD1845 family protein [Clostridia bacterium]|nr:CD1845 family protein [Clostridia bacterium]
MVVWFFAFLLNVSAFVFDLAGTVLGIIALFNLFTGMTTNGIMLLVIAWLVSPFGAPMAAAWLLGKLQELKFFIQDSTYS